MTSHIHTLSGLHKDSDSKKGLQTPLLMDLRFGLKIVPTFNFHFSNFMDCQSLARR